MSTAPIVVALTAGLDQAHAVAVLGEPTLRVASGRPAAHGSRPFRGGVGDA